MGVDFAGFGHCSAACALCACIFSLTLASFVLLLLSYISRLAGPHHYTHIRTSECVCVAGHSPRPKLVYGLPMWKWKLFVPGPKTPTTTPNKICVEPGDYLWQHNAWNNIEIFVGKQSCLNSLAARLSHLRLHMFMAHSFPFSQHVAPAKNHPIKIPCQCICRTNRL